MQKAIKAIFRITLLAFIINAILPFFAVYNLPSNSAEAKGLSSVFGDKILICTSDGFKWVSLEDWQSGSEIPQEHQDYECALCYVSAKNSKDFILVEVAAVYLPEYVKYNKTLPVSQGFSHQLFLNYNQSRAPPYLS